jgi:hypothetical protein
VLARAIEETGLPTVTVALVKEHAQRVKPPRTLWVPFPFGFALGNPDDPPFQQQVLSAALGLLSENDTPVLAEFPEDADAQPVLLQASAAQADAANRNGDPADEVTALRGYYERWVDEHEGRTMVGLSGVPQRRFRGLVRAMQAFASGDDTAFVDLAPEDVPPARFVRLASDDLKAFFMEARFSQRPNDRDDELQRWFWSETAMGNLIASAASRLTEQGNEQAAWGIAR